MSIPNEALQKLALEIESQASSALREINLVKIAIANKQRDARLLELTSTEISGLDKGTKLYEGVGKMFVHSPQADVGQRLSFKIDEAKADIASLNKKLTYLETTHKNSREHIEKIIGSSGAKP